MLSFKWELAMLSNKILEINHLMNNKMKWMSKMKVNKMNGMKKIHMTKKINKNNKRKPKNN